MICAKMLLPLIFLLPAVLGNETGSSDARDSSLLMPCTETSPERCPSDADCAKLGPECLICMCPAGWFPSQPSFLPKNFHKSSQPFFKM